MATLAELQQITAEKIAAATNAGSIVGNTFSGKSPQRSALFDSITYGNDVSTAALEGQFKAWQDAQKTLDEAKKAGTTTPEVIAIHEQSAKSAKEALEGTVKEVAPAMAHTNELHKQAHAALEAEKAAAVLAKREEFAKTIKKVASADIQAAQDLHLKELQNIEETYAKQAKPHLDHIEAATKLEKTLGEKGIKLSDHMSAKDAAKFGPTTGAGVKNWVTSGFKDAGHNLTKGTAFQKGQATLGLVASGGLAFSALGDLKDLISPSENKDGVPTSRAGAATSAVLKLGGALIAVKAAGHGARI